MHREAKANGNAVNLQIMVNKQITYYCLWTGKMFVFHISWSIESHFFIIIWLRLQVFVLDYVFKLENRTIILM